MSQRPAKLIRNAVISLKTKAGIPSYENIPANPDRSVNQTEFQVTVILASYRCHFRRTGFLKSNVLKFSLNQQTPKDHFIRLYFNPPGLLPPAFYLSLGNAKCKVTWLNSKNFS